LALPSLAACGSNGPEAQAPPPLSSLLATPSPTPKPPSGAVVTGAVRAFVNGLNTAFRTGNTTDANKASTASCKCRDQLSSIAAVYAKYEQFVGTHVVIVRLRATTLALASSQAQVTLRVPPSAIALSNGKHKPLKGYPPARLTATVVQEGGHWVVAAFAGLPRPELTSSPAPGSTSKPGG
jgi:hypothetical protein